VLVILVSSLPWALYCRGCLPLKERPHSEVVTRGVKVLLKRLLTAKGPITLVAFKVVGQRVEVLVQSMQATKGPIAIITLEDVRSGVKMLVECLPTAN
jgi:hypothetical protein